MKKLFPGQYWASWLLAAGFFAAVFPYGMFEDLEILPHYAWFCVLLNGLSTVLFRTILLRIWVKRFYRDDFSKCAWILAVQAFCHLVFGQMNAGSYWILGVTALIWLWMLLVCGKEWLAQRKRHHE